MAVRVDRQVDGFKCKGEPFMSMRNRNAFLAMLGLLAVVSDAQAARPQRFEREFLGIRLMSRGINVLRKYGSPNKVLVSSGALITFLTLRLPEKDFLGVSVNGLDTSGTSPGPYGMPGGPYSPGGAGPYPGGAGPYAPGGAGPYAPGGSAPGINSGDTTEQAGKTVFWIVPA